MDYFSLSSLLDLTKPCIAVRKSIHATTIVQWWIAPGKLRGSDTHALQGIQDLGWGTGSVQPKRLVWSTLLEFFFKICVHQVRTSTEALNQNCPSNPLPNKHAFLGVLADFTKVFPNYVVFQISTFSLILRINCPVFRDLLWMYLWYEMPGI